MSAAPVEVLTQPTAPWWGKLILHSGFAGFVAIVSMAGTGLLVYLDRQDRIAERNAFVATMEKLAGEIHASTASDAETRAVLRELCAPPIPPGPRIRR